MREQIELITVLVCAGLMVGCAFSGGQVILSTNVGGFDADGNATLDGVKDNPQNTTEPELVFQDVIAGASNEATVEEYFPEEAEYAPEEEAVVPCEGEDCPE